MARQPHAVSEVVSKAVITMQPVTLYTTRFCGYCRAAKQLLSERAVEYQEIAVDGNPALREEMMQRSGQRTVPQIWIGDSHVGGYSDLSALARSGRLDALLADDNNA